MTALNVITVVTPQEVKNSRFFWQQKVYTAASEAAGHLPSATPLLDINQNTLLFNFSKFLVISLKGFTLLKN